ncbi:serine hydrolase FSH [Cadophora sp. MPI-SDFR-AT-0126]|nr:serine hydrolase FSH [Leotiomycetes sp. MPI-SDFR-AT-0126]
MPPLRFLCLHGLGSNAKIFESQLGPLIRELSRTNSAAFHFLDGIYPQPAGPGISPLYPPPYYGYFRCDILQEAHDLPSLVVALNSKTYLDTVQEAHQLLESVIEEEGPFDGILGFSHGATLAFDFCLRQQERLKNQRLDLDGEEQSVAPLQCAVFIAGPAPFGTDGLRLKREEGEKPILMGLPTLHAMGKEDFLFQEAKSMFGICDEVCSELVVYGGAHEVPRDRESIGILAKAIRDLGGRIVSL